MGKCAFAPRFVEPGANDSRQMTLWPFQVTPSDPTLATYPVPIYPRRGFSGAGFCVRGSVVQGWVVYGLGTYLILTYPGFRFSLASQVETVDTY